MDAASRYKGSYQLVTENSKEVAQAFQWLYENTPLTYSKTLIRKGILWRHNEIDRKTSCDYTTWRSKPTSIARNNGKAQ